jgi:hypothetical protein
MADPEPTRGTLFVVEGDVLSAKVRAAAQQAGFGGDIISLSQHEAHYQHAHLPLLVTPNGFYGPKNVCDYFESLQTYQTTG